MSRESRSQRERRALFETGAPAAQPFTGVRDLYLCPICGTAFSESVLLLEDPPLTLEDVPPRSVGGKPIALTCKECNNTAGHSIDAAISARAKLMLFADVITHTVDGEGGRATMEIGSERFRVRPVAESNGPVRLEILGVKNNNPRVVERVCTYVVDHAREGTWTGGPLRITSLVRERYDPGLALVGDLKAAFIAAFATFGYRYVFNPRLALVRQQIRTPLEQVIDGWIPVLHQTETERCLVHVPEPISSVMVRLGRVDVLLPWLDSPLNFYDELAALFQSHGPREVIGEGIKWPTTLKMELDFQ